MRPLKKLLAALSAATNCSLQCEALNKYSALRAQVAYATGGEAIPDVRDVVDLGALKSWRAPDCEHALSGDDLVMLFDSEEGGEDRFYTGVYWP